MSLAKPLNITMRVLQFIWILLIMSLIGNIIHDAYSGNPAVINYDMFVAAFGMLSLFYLIPVSFNEDWAIHPIFPFVLDLLNTIFTFCGGVATAAKLHVHSCNNQRYLVHNSITNGAHNRTERCREAQASTAFLWFAFGAFLVSTIFSGMALASGGSSFRSSRGVRKGPAMSQV